MLSGIEGRTRPAGRYHNLNPEPSLCYGGESGTSYRPHDVQWARDMRRRCAAAGAAFFYKQSAAPRTEMGIELDGQIVRAHPTPPGGRAVGLFGD